MKLTHRIGIICVTLAASICCSGGLLQGQQPGVKDCLPVLAKDYYSYAQSSNLQEDFVKSINSESWEQLQQSNKAKGATLFSGGYFNFSDDFQKFSEKRSTYIEKVHYGRSLQQALDILQITTSPRAYAAYQSCLLSLDTGLALRVWAARETMDEIELHVKYVNPGGVKKMILDGMVTGGTVIDGPAGRLWEVGKVWGVNETKVFIIKRTAGTSATGIIVTSRDGATPSTATFQRADGVLSLSYVGTVDVMRNPNFTKTVHTPNNDNNKGNCDNKAGMEGRYCRSRSSIAIATGEGRFFANAKVTCAGIGCSNSREVSTSFAVENRSVVVEYDNWGRDVDATLSVEEYQRMTPAECGPGYSIPVVKGKPVLLTASKECLAIATLKWKTLPDGAEGAFRFGGKASAGSEVALDGEVLNNGTMMLAGYSLNK